MGKNRKTLVPAEDYLHLPAHNSYTSESPSIVDTHTHLLSTFSEYRLKYPSSKYLTVHDFAKGLYVDQLPPPSQVTDTAYARHQVNVIIDVWCEAPILSDWRELADSALDNVRERNWGHVDYYFVLGVHPHNAKEYTDTVEAEILDAMCHPRCVGWGEIGLDYHYMNSPQSTQQEVLVRQLRHAVRLGKPLTIHTREADEDIERILKEEVPKDHKIHVHCFTDSVELATRLLDYFPNLYIGITGVITYSTNLNTSAVIKHLLTDGHPSSSLRILLETDAPYMTPANLTSQILSLKSGQKLPFSHSGMIPWTAEFVASVIGGESWDTNRVLEVSRSNVRAVYGI